MHHAALPPLIGGQWRAQVPIEESGIPAQVEAGNHLEPGTISWSEWVKDYYRDVETYDWVDVADNLRGPEALFHRNRARVVRNLVARYATERPILDAGCGTGL